MSLTFPKPSAFRTVISVVGALVLSVGLAQLDTERQIWLTLWPSFVALCVVVLSRSALVGLVSGAMCGALLISSGSPLSSLSYLVVEQLLPIFQSSWKLSAIAFTLILGGFVALIERGGGLQTLVRRLLGAGRAPARRMQLTVFGMGLLVFFDGLANTMLIGRLLRSAADRCGVSRVKLAYLADATGSAVACLAFISTWIAFQLSMIRQGYEAVGQEVSAYALFFKSLPSNFYCWFALAMALVCVLRGFNPGPMARFEARAADQLEWAKEPLKESQGAHWLMALIPIAVLTFSIPVLSYVMGVDSVWPFSLAKFASAYGVAEAHVPWILVVSSVIAALTAACFVKLGTRGRGVPVSSVFLSGVKDLLKPIGILLAAWLLGGVISHLGAAEVISGALSDALPLAVVPVAIFGAGAAISFATGTSWGTMGVLMPLAIPVVFSLAGEGLDIERDRLVVAAIGAVFSGAVFGDHCSPFSDTTIVASIAAGVEPFDHVRTQLPFALITAGCAIVFGFLPLGYGLPAWACLMLGLAFLWVLPNFYRTSHDDTN